ncbi:MAG TPA: NYN domain-containing protein [Anaerolineales bacterium]|nr:NYN domain-containing protein [Anaerolineales bacterium]
MPYLIDGHNLIPKLGLRLDSIDDEMELVAILQEFCRLEQKQAEVFFDGAPAGQAGTRRLGTVTAHFVRLGTTADDAIRKRLKTLGRGARNWTVISSDHQVQAEASAVFAEVVSSDSFAGTLKQARTSAPKPDNERKLTPKEIDDWLRVFEERGRNKKYGG